VALEGIWKWKDNWEEGWQGPKGRNKGQVPVSAPVGSLAQPQSPNSFAVF